MPEAAYLVETWSKQTGWQLVGWFSAFDYAMRVATSLEVARVCIVDLDRETRRERRRLG